MNERRDLDRLAADLWPRMQRLAWRYFTAATFVLVSFGVAASLLLWWAETRRLETLETSTRNDVAQCEGTNEARAGLRSIFNARDEALTEVLLAVIDQAVTIDGFPSSEEESFRAEAVAILNRRDVQIDALVDETLPILDCSALAEGRSLTTSP